MLQFITWLIWFKREGDDFDHMTVGTFIVDDVRTYVASAIPRLVFIFPFLRTTIIVSFLLI